MANKKIKILGIPVYESRSTDDLSSIKNPKEWLLKILGQESAAGVNVTTDTAMAFSAVWACVRIISNSIAMLPFGVYQNIKNGRQSAPFHVVHKLIHSEPNGMMSSFTWRQVMQAHATLKGNGYSIIKRNGAYRPVELQLIQNPDDVEPFIYENKLYYKVSGPQGRDLPYPASEIIHIRGLGFDGLKGKSVLAVARESIGAALAMQQYGANVFKSGGAKRIALVTPGTISPETQKRMSDSWVDKYGNINQSGRPAILEGGVEVKEIGMNPEDAQFVASRQFSVNEIARFFGMILDLLATDKNPTYSSAEQRALDFIKYTLTPWLVTWESELNRKLFYKSEQGKFYVKFKLEGLLRGDYAGRAQFYKNLFYIGALSPDEVRKLEEMNSIPGGDKYYIPTNMSPAEDISAVYKSKNIKTDGK